MPGFLSVFIEANDNSAVSVVKCEEDIAVILSWEGYCIT